MTVFFSENNKFRLVEEKKTRKNTEKVSMQNGHSSSDFYTFQPFVDDGLPNIFSSMINDGWWINILSSAATLI